MKTKYIWITARSLAIIGTIASNYFNFASINFICSVILVFFESIFLLSNIALVHYLSSRIGGYLSQELDSKFLKRQSSLLIPEVVACFNTIDSNISSFYLGLIISAYFTWILVFIETYKIKSVMASTKDLSN
jgi:hypothetical protein